MEEGLLHVRVRQIEVDTTFDIYVNISLEDDRFGYDVSEVTLDEEGDLVSSKDIASTETVFDQPLDAIVDALRKVVVDELRLVMPTHNGQVEGEE